MSNLDLWDSFSKTDPKQTKKAKLNGMNITAICPQFQRKNATEKFGSYGIGWGIRPSSEEVNTYEIGDTLLASYSSTMFYIFENETGEFPICSSIKIAYMTDNGKGYLKVDDDFLKKLQTDALTKGLSFLGFNSDVFEGLFDDNKYVEEMIEKFKKPDNTPRITEGQLTNLVDLIAFTETNMVKFCAFMRVNSLDDLYASNFDYALSELSKKVK